MKKLMIALAAVTMTVAANAATTAWNISYSYQPGASTEEGPMAAGWAIAIFDAYSSSYTQQDVIDAINAKDTASFNTYKVALGTTGSDGNWAGTDDFTKKTVSSTDQTSAFAILFNNSDWTQATQYYLGENVQPVKSSTQTFTFGDGTGDGTADWVQTSNTAGWTDVVPEPTSGLLLLVGMGALALRRRRA